MDAELEDAGVELDAVLDSLEVQIDVFHALDLGYVGTHTLWVLADRIDLLLKPDLLILNPRLHSLRQQAFEDVEALLGHWDKLFTDC